MMTPSEHRSRTGRTWRLLCAALLLSFASGNSFADTRGKLTGRILDQANNPIPGANVLLVGTALGSAADVDGYYAMINVPAGMYDVRATAVGYAAKLVKEVRINAGQTTTLNITLPEQAVQAEEVTVVAERPLVDIRQTSAVSILGKDEFQVMPVQTLTDIVNLQAGVVDGHFRGGRSGEVQYQVDGVSVNNPYDNTSTLQLDKSVLQEVQVISGTFDAEYGQAMSGVVNAVLRSGSDEKFDAYAEVYGGDFVPNASNRGLFPHLTTFHPAQIQSYTLTVSGPTGLPQTAFLLNLRRYLDNGYLFGERRFLPTDSSDFQQKIFRPTGNGTIVPMNTTSELSWQFKLSNKSIPNVQLSYQAIGSLGSSRAYDFGYRFNPDGRTTQNRLSVVHGLDITSSLSPTTFYTVSLRQNYFEYTDWKYKNVDDPRYQSDGQPRGDANYELGAIIQGSSLGRFEQKTNSGVLKATITSQMGQHHLVKAGIEAQTSSITFGAPGTVYTAVVSGKEVLVSVVDDSLHPGLRTYHPSSLAAYVQDRMEFIDLLIRVGIRFEYFDANSKVPGDLQNPANAIRYAPVSVLKNTEKRVAIAPRLGVSYPITDKGAVYFSYGHFYQMPGLGLLYSNSNYDILKNLQAGSVSYGVMGNPDLKPEFTTQYEFGVKSEFGAHMGLDLSVFYKDIRNLLGVEFVSTYAAADYARFTNIDFGSVYGLTIAYDQRIGSALTWSFNYTYQKAIGNSSDPYETANLAAAGADPRPRQIPFEWDQTHTINCMLSLSDPSNYSATLIFRFGNGSPYTPAVGSGFGADLETNSARKPSWSSLDLRAEKYVAFGGMSFSLFFRAFNLLDAMYTNGFVFPTTGSADYSLTPAGDAVQLINPQRYTAPRRMEFGLSVKI